MTKEDVKKGVLVALPIRKTIGHPIEVFRNRVLRDNYEGNHLIPFIYNDKIYLRYPDEFAKTLLQFTQIQIHEFNLEDLDEFSTNKQVRVFRSNDQLDLLRNKEGVNKVFNLDPIPVADIQTDDKIIEMKPKHKDWEMGEPALVTITHSSEPAKSVGLRYNEGKLDYTLMDMRAFQPMIEVLEYGAHKYSTFKDTTDDRIYKGTEITKEGVKKFGFELVSSGRDNWKLGGPNMTLLSLLGSSMRHLASLLSGELYDKESNLSHIGHLACNVMFMGHFWEKYLKAKKSKQKSNFLDGLWKSGK